MLQGGGIVVGKPDFKNLLPQNGLGLGKNEMSFNAVQINHAQNLSGKTPPDGGVSPADGGGPDYHRHRGQFDLAHCSGVEPYAAPDDPCRVNRRDRRNPPAAVKKKTPGKKGQIPAVPGAQPRNSLPGLGLAPGDQKGRHRQSNHNRKKRHRKWHAKPPDSRQSRLPFSGCHDNPDS